jgi:quercetin dioxygenase-like cupin family protein
MKKIKLPVAFKDKRGEIIDLIQKENINAVTMITFAKGVVRGNHYHKKTFQWNYLVSGKIRLASQMPGKKIRETVMKEGDFILTVPHEKHALESIKKSLLLVLTKGPRGGKEYESDTFRLETPLINKSHRA